MRLILIAIIVLILCACSDFSLSPRGNLGEACFGNGTCSQPFICVENFCAAQNGDTDTVSDSSAKIDTDTAATNDADAFYSDGQQNDSAIDDSSDSITPDEDTASPWDCGEGEQCWKTPSTSQGSCFSLTGTANCPSEGAKYYGQDAQYGDSTRTFTQEQNSGTTIIHDALTSLFWQKAIDSATKSHADAVTYCDSLSTSSYGGKTGWRLPTQHELASIIDFEKNGTDPIIDDFYFPGTPAKKFWTNTPLGSNNYYYIDFSGDSQFYAEDPTALNYVRCVNSPWNYIKNYPAPRWKESTAGSDALIEDIRTGLIWQKTFLQTGRTWEDALAYCEGLTYGQKSDWRLPDINELHSLVVHDSAPEHATTFPGISDEFFWSSTTNSKIVANAWLIEFKYGIIKVEIEKTNTTNGILAICVRN